MRILTIDSAEAVQESIRDYFDKNEEAKQLLRIFYKFRFAITKPIEILVIMMAGCSRTSARALLKTTA